MKVCVIGQGYVGLPIALSAAAAGHATIGFDIDRSLVEKLNAGQSHIEDISDDGLSTLLKNKSYEASSNSKSIDGSDVVIICVPTPLDEKHLPDTSLLEAACELIGQNLTSSALVINESTSYPGTLRNLIKPIIDGLKSPQISHLYAISPERVDPGNLTWSIKNTPRLLAGLSPEATKMAEEFYLSICDEVIVVNSPEVAETAKLFENTYRQVNIALVNELALITHALGISVNDVLAAASTKPYGFTKFTPGIGVGGHCIPVDPTYLAYASKKVGIHARFIELANQVNLGMPKEILNRIKAENGDSLRGKSVLIVGVAYKSDVSDVRESPSIKLINELKNEDAVVYWHDPIAKQWDSTSSTPIQDQKFDITIICLLHKAMDTVGILESAEYIFDCTGKLSGAIHL
jgi:UDP-N-acetyl-D-glucosamine dehydrogenase